MLKALFALVGVLRSAWLIEAAGAALIVWGVYEKWGEAVALIVAGSALVLKAFEIEGRNG